MKSPLFKVINPPLGTTGPIYFRRAEPDGTVIQLFVRRPHRRCSPQRLSGGQRRVFAAEITDCYL
ncbi:hypothetical protein [Streptomyces griseoluteus]|uniref:hypothetical protein n=1 Tax=Streptomyces griseoluteus TaxID=29306 RepID=UPI0036FCC5C7